MSYSKKPPNGLVTERTVRSLIRGIAKVLRDPRGLYGATEMNKTSFRRRDPAIGEQPRPGGADRNAPSSSIY